jgi:hypothetical protein
MAMEIRVSQGLRAAGESMHDPAFGEQTFGQGEAKALGSAGDESGGHWF